MADLQLLLEAEKRGLLPPDRVELLNEARKRGIIPSIESVPKQSFTTNAMQIDPDVPEWGRRMPALYGLAGAARETLGPLAEFGGMVGGAMAGAPAGPVSSVVGAGLGYGMGKQATRAADIALGNVKGQSLPDEAVNAVGNVAAGGAMEMGGQVLAPVLGAAVKGVARGAGAVADLANRPTIKAAKIAKDALGQDLAAARTALHGAPADVTAGQALANINSPTAQALLSASLERDPRFAMGIQDAQEAARKSALSGVTPDLAAAESARDAVSKVGYGKARAADTQRLDEVAAGKLSPTNAAIMGKKSTDAIGPALFVLKANPAIASAAKEAKTLAATNGVEMGDPMASLQGLHYMKIAIDNQFKNRAAATALQNYSDAVLTNTKQQLLGAIDEISPLYGVARGVYADMSAPVNQSKVLGEMQNILAKPTGGERVAPFLNALGNGEKALLKKSTGAPRYEAGDLAKVLTPEQMGVVRNTADQLLRDIRVASQAKAGGPALNELLSENAGRFRLPNFLNPKIAMANRALDVLESKLGKNVLNKLTEAAKSGKSFDDLLGTLPAVERNKILKAMANPEQWLPKKAGAVKSFLGYTIDPIGSVNALTQ